MISKENGVDLIATLAKCHGKVTSVRQLVTLLSASVEPGIMSNSLARILNLALPNTRGVARQLEKVGLLRVYHDAVEIAGRHRVVRRHELTEKGDKLILGLFAKEGGSNE